MPARQTARKVLMLCRTRGAWSDAVLREQIEAAGLDRKDAVDTEQAAVDAITEAELADVIWEAGSSGGPDGSEWVVTLGDPAGHDCVRVVCDSGTGKVLGYLPVE